MKNDIIKLMDQETYTLTSMEVAEMVEKRHNDLLRDIRNYIEKINKNDERKNASVEFFQESKYTDNKGETRPCYLITRKGCEFIAHKLTGEKGIKFTAQYINKFHEMESQIYPLEIQAELNLLQEENQELKNRIMSIEKSLSDFQDDMPLLAIDAEKIIKARNKVVVNLLGGIYSNAYKDRSLRDRIYADLTKEINRKFSVSSYKAIKRNQCHIAIDMINSYRPHVKLQEEIIYTNNQLRL